jgi:hypothetical protein
MKFTISLSITFIIVSTFVTIACLPKSGNMVSVNHILFTSRTVNAPYVETATARKETYSDFQKFLRVAKGELTENELLINEFLDCSTQVQEGGQNVNVMKANHLKEKNSQLGKKLDEYVKNGTGNWRVFESDFKFALNQLQPSNNHLLVSVD